MMRTKCFRLVTMIIALLLIGISIIGCTQSASPPASPAPVTTPTSAPAISPAPKTTAAPAPAAKPVAWTPVWKNGVLQPLPDGFPNRPIILWNAWAPGHSDDLYSRAMSKATQSLSPVPLACETGNVGQRGYWAMLDKMQTLPNYKEGYHLSVCQWSNVSLQCLTRDRGKWASEDMNPIIGTDETGTFVSVKTDAPWKNLAELVAYSKANPKKIRFGAPVGAGTHIVGMQIQMQAGVEWTLVPHSGSNVAMLTMMGGGIEVVCGSPAIMKSYLDAGTARALALSVERRSDYFPDISTFKELGFKNINSAGGRGFWTYPDVPDTHIQWLFELFKAGSQQQAYIDYNILMGLDNYLRGPDDIKVWRQETIEEFTPIIKNLGLFVAPSGK